MKIAPAALRPAASLAAALAAALWAGCGPPPEPGPGPLDRFNFPVGIEATPAGELLVASSNYELDFNSKEGGTLLRVDPSATPAAFRGGVRFSSYGGEVAYADAAACGIGRSLALVTSRGDSGLHAYALDDDGGLSCGPFCQVLFQDFVFTDPYGVEVACPPGGEPAAFVGFLRPVSPDGAIARVSLADDLPLGKARTLVRGIGAGAPRSFAFDPVSSRLYYTTLGVPVQALLRWVELAGGCAFDEPPAQGGCQTGSRDLFLEVKGAELQGLALSNPQDGLGRRLYVAARLFDAALAAVIGRPSFDVGGVLIVLDLDEGVTGLPALRLVDVVPIGLGSSEVAVLPARSRRACAERPDGCPRRDVVVVAAADDGVVAVYDDELGAVVKVFEREAASGAPVLGRLPFGLAVTDAGAGVARVYVSSFLEGFVTPVDVPLDDPGAAAIVEVDGRPRRIGQEGP